MQFQCNYSKFKQQFFQNKQNIQEIPIISIQESQMPPKKDNPKKTNQDNQKKILKQEKKKSKNIKSNLNLTPELNYQASNSYQNQPPGQSATNQAEKKHKQCKQKIQEQLKNYHSADSLTGLSIIRYIFSGIEPCEILEFIDFKIDRFLYILQLMIGNQTLPGLKNINYTQELVNEPVPRSISYGLRRMRQDKGLTDINSPFYISMRDLKCLYMSKLLLISVGQVNKRIINKQKGQQSERYFHRIVTHLLENNDFLTPKLFYFVEKKWQLIMRIITKQFREDRKQKSIKPQMMQSQEKVEQKREKNQSTAESRMQDQPESYQSYHHDFIPNIRQHDYQQKLFQSEKKKDRQESQRERQHLLHGTAQKKKEISPSLQYNDEVKTIKLLKKQQNIKSDYYAVHKAQKHFNFRKVRTFPRKKNKKITKSEKDNPKTKENKNRSKSFKKEQTKNQEQKIQEQHFDEKMANDQEMDQLNERDYQNIYGEKPMFLDENSQGIFYEQGQSEDNMFEQEEINSEQIQSRERVQMQENFDRMAVESENISIVEGEVNIQNEVIFSEQQQMDRNPRQVTHQNRQIDVLLSKVLQNRDNVIESIANHLYYELLVWNVRLIEDQDEEELSCRRNLFGDYKK